MSDSFLPIQQGLYDPRQEHDACGVGFVAHIKGKKSHSIVEQGLLILKNLDHRGAVGAGRSFPPQARSPRLLRADGVGVSVDVSACSRSSRARLARVATTSTLGEEAVAGLAGVGTEPDLGVGRDSLQRGAPVRVRDRRSRVTQVDRHPHVGRGDLHPGRRDLRTCARDTEQGHPCNR